MCTAAKPCRLRKIRPLDQYPIPFFDARADGKKAAANAFLNKVWIERPVWEGIADPRLKAVLVAHEYGHLDGADCEDCADLRAGELMRAWGIDGESAGQLLNNLLQYRDGDRAQAQVIQGYQQQPVGVVSFHGGESLDERRAKVAARGADNAWVNCHRALDQSLLRSVLFGSATEPLKSVVIDQLRRPRRAYGADAAVTSSADLAAELRAKAPARLIRQSFATQQSASDDLAQIIADVAIAFFPDDPRRYAWLLLAMVSLEAPRVGSTAILNPQGDNSKSGPGGTPLNRDGSIDYGLMQINGTAHADMIAQTFADGSPQWQDARANIGMGATILADARAHYPASIPSQLLYYAGGGRYLANLGTIDPKAYTQDALLALASGMTSAQIAKLNNAQVELLRLAKWGVADPTDNGAWVPVSSDPVTAIADAAKDTAGALDDALQGNPVPPRARNDALWFGLFLGLTVALVVVIWSVASSAPTRRAA